MTTRYVNVEGMRVRGAAAAAPVKTAPRRRKGKKRRHPVRSLFLLAVLAAAVWGGLRLLEGVRAEVDWAARGIAVEDGTAAEIEIDDEGNFDPEDPNAYMDAYAYVENADGTYDIITGTGYRIFDSDAVLLLNGTVENDNGDIYSVPSDADIWDVTDMSDAEDDISEGEFTYIESHAVIVPTEVGGHTMRTAWVWEIDSTTETPVQGATFTDYVDEDPTTGAIELYWYDEHNVAPTTRDIRELMADYLGENVERAVQISGQWFAITEDGDWWDLDLVQIRKVTYGNQTRWVRNATNDLIGHSAITFTASDDLENGDAVLMDATSTLYAGSETTDATFTGDRSSFEYTGSVAGDIELSDAYALNAAGIVKTMEILCRLTQGMWPLVLW